MSRVKNVAAIVVILGIAVLFLTSSSTNLPVLSDLGKYLKIPSFSLPIIGSTPSGNSFSFTLESPFSLLDRQTLAAQNSNIVLVATSFSILQIGDSFYQPQGRVDAQIYNFNGQAQFNYGTITLVGQADSATAGSFGISPITAGQKLKISAQFFATNYTISSLSKQPLVLQNVYGLLTKTTGTLATQQLANESLRIDGFQGSSQLSGKYLITGFAVSIKGNTFSWTG